MTRHVSFERTIPVDPAAAARVLRERPVALVQGAQDALVLHASVAGFDVAREVVVTFAPVHEPEDHVTVLPLQWEASQGPGRFPTFTGVLEVSALSERPPRCQVALVGSIRPPLGPVGRVAESVATGAIEDEVLAALVEQVAARLQELVAIEVGTAAEALASSNRGRRTVVLPD